MLSREDAAKHLNPFHSFFKTTRLQNILVVTVYTVLEHVALFSLTFRVSASSGLRRSLAFHPRWYPRWASSTLPNACWPTAMHCEREQRLTARSATADSTAFNTGGKVSVGGLDITIPKNLQIQFPAAWVPFKEFVAGGYSGSEISVQFQGSTSCPMVTNNVTDLRQLCRWCCDRWSRSSLAAPRS